MRLVTTLVSGLLMLTGHCAHAAGFQSATAPDPADKPLAIGIWYPSDTPAPSQPNTPFGQTLALNGEIAGKRLPVVIISHGSGGWLGSHADTALALADAGYVVVALTHTGNNYKNDTYSAKRWMADRPRHVSRVLDFLLTEWSGRGHLDPSRIGIFGFSAGAYTALVASGGIPNLEKAAAHCADDPDEVACTLGLARSLETTENAPSAWNHDARLKAAVAAAPGFGFAFDKKGLAGVRIPMQLWAGAEDRVVPFASNTQIVQQSLPVAPDLRIVEKASHSSFLAPCDPRLEAAQPKIWAMDCVDGPDFDRRAFHDTFNGEVVRFFDRTLKNR